MYWIIFIELMDSTFKKAVAKNEIMLLLFVQRKSLFLL